MVTALQVSQVQWVTKEKQESQAEWKAAKDLRVRRETEVFQVCIPENGIYAGVFHFENPILYI